MKHIEIIDNILSEKQKYEIFKYVKEAKYIFGIADSLDGKPSGLSHQDDLPDDFLKIINNDLFPRIKNWDLNKYYLCKTVVNLFIPGETPNFHKDLLDGITILYYCNLNYDVDDGGETYFINMDDNTTLTGIMPIPGRFVIFDGNILHRASSFNNKHRFTIALQYALK